MSINLDKLRELTPKLSSTPDFSDHVINGVATSRVVMNTEAGDGCLLGIWKEPNLGICKAVYKGGTEHHDHIHPEHEWLMLLKGKAKIWIGKRENEEEYKPNKMYYIPPNTPHGTVFIEDTELLAITMPSSTVFPEYTYMG